MSECQTISCPTCGFSLDETFVEQKCPRCQTIIESKFVCGSCHNCTETLHTDKTKLSDNLLNKILKLLK